MKKIIVMLLISALLLILGLAVKPAVCSPTVVEVDPSLIEYNADATGQQFTVAVKIVDVTNLYGFDIKFRWNTTFLDYVSNSVRVPKDTYPDGVLWNPVIPVMNEVNTTAGTYWIAYSSRWPAPTFNGSGTVFTMTFSVKHHPVQPEPTANIILELYSTDLAASDSSSIPHTTQDGTVILYALAVSHDVAVTEVKPYKTIIFQGFCSNITVTVANPGGYTETFDVTAYINATVIATITDITLTSGNSVVQTIVWNTTGFVKGNYIVSAYAWPVADEANTANNNCTGGWVLVAMVGDLTGTTPGVPDGKVDIKDISLVAKNFGKTVPPAPSNCDVTGPIPGVPDGKIDIRDISLVAKHFGEHSP
jgi:hypothetical protein